MDDSVLDKYGHNLTAEARAGRLDPVIGREQEIDRILQVLSRRTKNNPLLVGEPGVDNTAVVEGLAQKIAIGRVPDPLKGTQLYSLDRKLLVMGSATRATIGSRLNEIFEEVKSRGNIIIFIDELQLLFGTNAPQDIFDMTAEQKPLLASGDFRVITAMAPYQYRKRIEAETVLERIFEPIQVSEATISNTIEILKGERTSYETYHRVLITDAALVAAAVLTDRYIDHRVRPGKALDLIDDAASRARIKLIGRPPDIQEYQEKIGRVRSEKEAAIDSQDFERAAALRATETQLIAKMDVRVREWDADVMQATVEADEDLVIEAAAVASGIPEHDLRRFLDSATASFHGDANGRIAESQDAFVLLNDQPLDDANGDLLNTSDIAERIASLLKTSRSASPLVVALDAGWGMGKSTLLRQIESRLADQPGIKTARFNAWTAQGDNALEGLIKSVLINLDPNMVRRYARRLLRSKRATSFARIGFTLIARFFGMARLVDELWDQLAVDARSRNELRDLIREMLVQWIERPGNRDPRRVLVLFIDDLDRCPDEVIVKICEAVKLYLDAPGLIFVVACDLSVIARGVSSATHTGMSEGRVYLEKIVQVVHRMPPPDEDQIGRLILGYAQRSGTAALMDTTVVDILSERAGRNPRRIKRIINSVVLERQLNPAWGRPPLNSFLLVTAILLQHLYPAFYDLLVNEESEKDPITEFLDYIEVRARVSSPPPEDHQWWSLVTRVFEEHEMPAPDRSAAAAVHLISEIERLERNLPEGFPALARNKAFVALLRGIGDYEARRALRAQLISRPLEVGVVLDEDIVTPASVGTLAGRRIVCIDDNPSSIDHLVSMLEGLDASVMVFTGPGEADAEILRRAPDAVVSDITRGVDPTAGFDHIAQLRANGYDGLVIFFTARITPERRSRATELTARITNTERDVIDALHQTMGLKHHN